MRTGKAMDKWKFRATVMLFALGISGCRVTENDIRRWEQTELGPGKLVAVVTHDKYEWSLRRDAAMALIRMKPRNGRRVGLQCETKGDHETPSLCLQDAVASLSPEERKQLMTEVLPILVTEIEKLPATSPQASAPAERKEVDPTIPYKDAGFALLTYDKDKAVLISDEDQRKKLRDALIKWATTDFDRRIGITSQLYGLEQLFRQFGADGVRSLPARIQADVAYDRVAALIAELGDAPTKDDASKKLVALAQQTESHSWVEKKRPQVKEANQAAGYRVEGEKLDRQIRDFQEEQLIKVFAAMKKVGGRPVVDYLLGVVLAKDKPEKRRQAAAAALDGKLDRGNPSDIQRILALATSEDTPDGIREIAFQRVSEMPREQVVGKLYELFPSKKWKLRWTAASTVLKMSSAKDVGEFLSKLPAGAAPGFAMSEPLLYGELFGKMKPPPAREVFADELKHEGKEPKSGGSLAARLTAIGYFYTNGKANDVSLLQSLEDDKTALPKVEDADAKWQCSVAKVGSKLGETDVKDLATVGEFVKFCVMPQVKSRK